MNTKKYYCAIKGCKERKSKQIGFGDKLCESHASIYVQCYKQGNDYWFSTKIFAREMGGVKRGYTI